MINRFDSAIFIPQTGKVEVVETLAVDFGTLAKYGIFRTIPAGGIRFRLRSVKQDGQSAKVGTSSSGGGGGGGSW